MAPSKESRALGELFKEFGVHFPQDGNTYLERVVYERVLTVGAEAPGVTYESTTAAGRPAIWIRPAGASENHVVLFMHGGGYSFGSPNGHRRIAAHLAKACNCISLSVDYRLTPEHPFPAPVDDCIAAYKWLLDQGYPAQNIVTAGDSCGGGLSASVPLGAVQKGYPKPGAAVALSPWFDATATAPSIESNADKDLIQSREFIEMLADRFTDSGKTPKAHPLVSPLHADLKDLPPIWISAAGDDMLRDDGVRMAEKAKKAGIDVVLEVHENQQHVFEFMAGRAPEADESLRKIGEWVRKKIGS